MSQQAELTCVSCDTSFEPEPNGGFCPNCDTPHPDYGVDDEEEADTGVAEEPESTDDAEAEAADAGADADDAGAEEADLDAGPSFCPDCGADLAAARTTDASDPLEACPSCGRSVAGESYCPDCGEDLDAVREDAETDDAGDAEADEADADDEAAEADDEAAADDGAEDAAAEADAETVTLVVNGSEYEFGDGDTFGRRDGGWLEDLVAAAGGSDDVAYVSSEHLQFDIEDGDAFVVDVSRNGTQLNDKDLDGGKAKLQDGDTMTLAERAEVEVQL